MSNTTLHGQPMRGRTRDFTSDPQIKDQLAMDSDAFDRWVRERVQALGQVAAQSLTADAYRARVQEFKRLHGDELNLLVNILAVAKYPAGGVIAFGLSGSDPRWYPRRGHRRPGHQMNHEIPLLFASGDPIDGIED